MEYLPSVGHQLTASVLAYHIQHNVLQCYSVTVILVQAVGHSSTYESFIFKLTNN